MVGRRGPFWGAKSGAGSQIFECYVWSEEFALSSFSLVLRSCFVECAFGTISD